ncbi:YDG domain-containing protein [Rubneribacter sp.]
MRFGKVRRLCVIAALAAVASAAAPGAASAGEVEVGSFTLSNDAETPILNTDYTYSGSTLTIISNKSVTVSMKDAGSTSTTDNIVVNVGPGNAANLTLDNVSIDVSDADGRAALRIQSGDAVIELDGRNVLKSGSHRGGLQLGGSDGARDDTGTLVVNDSNATAGSLTAEGGDDGAGIGSGGYWGRSAAGSDGQNLSSGSLPAGWKAVGSITINGGTITAVGKRGGAGIGGGSLTSAGDIAINGGVVTATASGTARYDYNSHNVEAMGGAGIGSGAGWGFWIRSGYNRTATVTCGKIAISGGEVTATGSRMSPGIGGASCIGSGDGVSVNSVQRATAAGSVVISDGVVTANGGEKAAGIGAGQNSSNKLIDITGGTVRANGGNCPNGERNVTGIGGAYNSNPQTFTISGGSIWATAKSNSPYINAGAKITGGFFHVDNPANCMDKQSVYSVVPQPGYGVAENTADTNVSMTDYQVRVVPAPALSVANASENSFTYGEKTGQQIIDDLGAVTATSHTEALMPEGAAIVETEPVEDRVAYLVNDGEPGVAYNGWSWLAGYRELDPAEHLDAGAYTLMVLVEQSDATKADPAAGSTNPEIAPAFRKIALTVDKKPLAEGMFNALADSVYSGVPQTPTPSIADGEPLLTEGDYTVSYADNANAGTATVTATASADGNYSGSASLAWTIDKAVLTVKAEDQTVEFGAAPAANRYAFDGFVNGEDAASANIAGAPLITWPSYVPGASGPGSYDFSLAVGTLDAPNYRFEADAAQGVLTVTTAATRIIDVVAADCVYGDTLTVTGKVAAPASASVPAGSVTLSYHDGAGDHELGDAALDAATGGFVLEYDTSGKAVPTGAGIKVDVKYAGSDDGSFASASDASATFDLAKKEITPRVAGDDTREYDGTTDVTGAGLSVEFDGKLQNDAVACTASWAYADAAAGTREVGASGIQLADDWGAWYAPTADAAVKTDVTGIVPRAVTLAVADATVPYRAGSLPAFSLVQQPVSGSYAAGEGYADLGVQNLAFDVAPTYDPAASAQGSTHEVAVSSQTVANNANYKATFAPGTLTVVRSSSAVVGVKTYDETGATEKSAFTYGDKMVVKGTVSATGTAATRALAAPAANEVALYHAGAGAQLSEPAPVQADGSFELRYDTAEKGIGVDPAGTDLEVRYVGTADQGDAVATVTVTLAKKAITVSLGGAAAKAYDGTDALPQGHAVTWQASGLESDSSDADAVAVGLSNLRYTGAAAGTTGVEGTASLDEAALDGGWYRLADAAASGAVADGIEKAVVSVYAPDQEVVFGWRWMPVYELSGFANGEDQTTATGFSGAPSFGGTGYQAGATPAGSALPIVVDVSGMTADNYRFQAAQQQGELAVVASATSVAASVFGGTAGAADSFVYGDVATVSGTVSAAGSAQQPTGDVVLCAVAADGSEKELARAAVGADGSYSVSYGTSDKGIDPAKGVQLIVRFNGGGSFQGSQAAVSLDLAPKALAPSVAGDASKVYDGTAGMADATGLSVLLAGALPNDSVSAAADWSFDAPGAGTTGVTAANISLEGADARFYELSAQAASGSVATGIQKAVLHVAAEDVSVKHGQALPAFTRVVTGFVNGETEATAGVAGDAVLSCPGYTPSAVKDETFDIEADVTGMSAANYRFEEAADKGQVLVVENDSVASCSLSATALVYGDTLTVTGTVAPDGAVAGVTADGGRMGVYLGQTRIGWAEVQPNGTFAIEYATTDKQLLPGAHSNLTLRYSGNHSLAWSETAVQAVELGPLSVRPSVAGDASKPYDGTDAVTDASGLSVELATAFAGDDVSATADWAFVGRDAGETGVEASGIALAGTAAPFYELAAQAAFGTVATGIQKAPLAVETATLERKDHDGADRTATVSAVGLSGFAPGEENAFEYGRDFTASAEFDAGSYAVGPDVPAKVTVVLGQSMGNYYLVDPEFPAVGDVFGNVVLPGPDGQGGTDDDVTVSPDAGADEPISTDPSTGAAAVPEPGAAVTYPDGEGGSFTVEVPGGAQVNPDGSIRLPGNDGATGTGDDPYLRPNKGASANGDGSWTLPEGGTVEMPDGTVKEAPAGSTVLPDGTIAIDSTPIGPATVILPGPDGQTGTDDDLSVKPGGGGSVATNPDGSVTVPEGGATVTYPDEEGGSFTVEVPEGTVIDPDGSVRLPGEDGAAGTDDDPHLSLTPGATVDGDGVWTLPEGGSVSYPGEGGGHAVDLPAGSMVNPDGSIRLPGEDGVLGSADDPALLPGPGAYPNPEGYPEGSWALPEGGIVVMPDGTAKEAPAGSVVLPDGTIVVPEKPVPPAPSGSEGEGGSGSEADASDGSSSVRRLPAMGDAAPLVALVLVAAASGALALAVRRRRAR